MSKNEARRSASVCVWGAGHSERVDRKQKLLIVAPTTVPGSTCCAAETPSDRGNDLRLYGKTQLHVVALSAHPLPAPDAVSD